MMETTFYPLDEVSSAELAEGLEKISEETAKTLLLQKNKERTYSSLRNYQLGTIVFSKK